MSKAPSRVVIRPPTQADAAVFLQAVAWSRRLHGDWVTPPRTSLAFRHYLQKTTAEAHRGFVVFEKDTGALVGVINLSHIIRGWLQSAFISYYAFAPHAGRGLMKEGMLLVLRHAFRRLKLHRVEANIQPANHPSLGLARNCGFVREGYSRQYLKIAGRWRDHERWAIVRETRATPVRKKRAREDSNLEQVAILRKGDRDVGQSQSRESAHRRETLAQMTRNMDECRPFDGVTTQRGEQVSGHEVRQFAHQQVSRSGQERQQILRRAQISAVDDPATGAFEHKTERLETLFVLLSERPSQTIQMRSGKRRDPYSAQTDCVTTLERLETELEAEQFLEEVGVPEHLPQWFNRLPRQIDGQRPGPPFQPETLQEHEETSDMVRMSVREDDRVQPVPVKLPRCEGAANRLAAIEQDAGAAEFVKVAGVVAVGARPAVPGAKTQNLGGSRGGSPGRHVRSLSRMSERTQAVRHLPELILN